VRRAMLQLCGPVRARPAAAPPAREGPASSKPRMHEPRVAFATVAPAAPAPVVADRGAPAAVAAAQPPPWATPAAPAAASPPAWGAYEYHTPGASSSSGTWTPAPSQWGGWGTGWWGSPAQSQWGAAPAEATWGWSAVSAAPAPAHRQTPMPPPPRAAHPGPPPDDRDWSYTGNRWILTEDLVRSIVSSMGSASGIPGADPHAPR
jgi:hypothetical protein